MKPKEAEMSLGDYSRMNLGDYIDDACSRFADDLYLTFYDQTYTYNQFLEKVHVLANALKKLGIKKGDFVHVWVQNSPETLISYYAIIKIGAVAGPINGWWKGPEVEYLLNDSGAKYLIVEDQYLPIFDEIKKKCPELNTVICIGDTGGRGDFIRYDDLVEQNDTTDVKCGADPEDTAFIFYTSGTTGNPKGVLLSHKNVVADCKMINAALKTEGRKNCLCFLPLFHVNAMVTCLSAMDKGHHIVLRKTFSATEFWEVVEKYKINFWSAVPAVYQILLSDPSRQKYDLSSMEFGICGAAPLTEELARKFEETFKIPIVEGYGLTEGTCVSTINPIDGVRKIGSIGLPLPGQKVLIVDENGNECPANVPGEIVIQGDNVMKGYYNKPEETAETLRDGFLHTGDVGIKDEDGYIFIVDRIKDMIIRGGENIYPKEIDNLLATHPKIAEAATVGVPDPVMGEEVKVFVLPSDDTLTEEEVIEFCKKNLASFKVPKYVEILDQDFPRNPIGKVLKKTLREWAVKGTPKKEKSKVTVADIFGTMESRVNPEGVKGVTANYGYIITGEGGGEWTVCVKDGQVKVLEGLCDPDVTTTCAARDWIDITLGKLDGMTAFSSGKLKVEGDLGLLTKATKFFKKYQPPAGDPEVTVEDIFNTMESRVNPDGVKGVTANYGYVITGKGGGEWTVCVKDGQVKVLEGLHDPDVTTTCSARDWIDITLGKLDGMTAFTSGRLKVEGDLGLLTKATKFFKKYQPPGARAVQAEAEELIVKKMILSIPQKFATGPVMGKFLNAFKEKKILANKCPKCGRLQLPPREVCAECVVRADQWVEVGPEGILTLYDITYYASPDPLTGESRETPYISAHFLLDGCKGHETLWHELNPDDIDKCKKGARVRPVWAKERKGAITDIKYFTVID